MMVALMVVDLSGASLNERCLKGEVGDGGLTRKPDNVGQTTPESGDPRCIG